MSPCELAVKMKKTNEEVVICAKTIWCHVYSNAWWNCKQSVEQI